MITTPKTVAVIGASADRRKFGNKAVRAFRAAGWRVFPVNPREADIEGLETFASVADIAEPLDSGSIPARKATNCSRRRRPTGCARN